MAENTNTQVNETHEEEQEESQKPDGVLTKNINGSSKKTRNVPLNNRYVLEK